MDLKEMDELIQRQKARLAKKENREDRVLLERAERKRRDYLRRVNTRGMKP